MTQIDDTLSAQESQSDDSVVIRRCIACEYDLRGLGVEPRCPECGLVNVAQDFRDQVWRLIDQGAWLITPPQGFIQKRPPGWWWSLDRDGDVRRSMLRAFDASLIAALIILGFGTASASFCETQTIEFGIPIHSGPRAPVMPAGRRVYVTTTAGFYPRIHDSVIGVTDGRARGMPYTYAKPISSVTEWTFRPTYPALGFACLALIWTIATWAGPATVGLWTQIRKGLPDFARAPRTIIAASGYESHRLLYLAPVVAIGFVADAAMRYNQIDRSTQSGVLTAIVLFAIAFGAAGWIGPIRTDHTRQLVRSTLHGVRIVVMYAIALPLVVLIIATCGMFLTWRYVF
jgi:hypothetical protein